MTIKEALGFLAAIADKSNGNGDFHRQVGLAVKVLSEFIEEHSKDILRENLKEDRI